MGQNALPATGREDFAWVPITKERAFTGQYNSIRARDKSLKLAVERQHLINIVAEDKKLQECDPMSLANVLSRAALTGLSLDPDRKHLYVATYNTNVGTYDNPQWVKLAKVGMFYQGLMHLAYGSDLMVNLQAEVVYTGDKFEYGRNQDGPWFTHDQCKKERDRGDPIGVYCYAKFKRHGGFFDYLTAADIDKVKQWILNQQKKPNNARDDWAPQLSMAWTYWWTEKWKITAIRRCSKQWPKDDALMRTLAALDTIEDEVQFDDDGEIRQTEEPEYLCISEEQLDELHDMILVDFPGEDRRAVAWLEALAGKMVGEGQPASAIPASRFEEARDLIAERLKKVADARKPEEGENGNEPEPTDAD